MNLPEYQAAIRQITGSYLNSIDEARLRMMDDMEKASAEFLQIKPDTGEDAHPARRSEL